MLENENLLSCCLEQTVVWKLRKMLEEKRTFLYRQNELCEFILILNEFLNV